LFAGFRVIGVDDRGSLVQRRPKFTRLFLQADDAPVMLRSKAARHKINVFNSVLRSAHLEFSINSPADLTEEEVIKRLRSAGGAHQPTGYEF
jgi:hypothetical protein